MKKKLKAVMIMMLVLVLMLPQAAYAGRGNDKGQKNGVGNGDKVPYGQMKKMEEYKIMNGEMIHVRNRNVDFDVPPVLKGGRTLIPVRAVTSALGCEVEWIEPKAFIISPDGKIMVFDLSTSKVYVTSSYTFEELLKIDSEIIWDSMEKSIDIGPGLINNRTFVPLRFIATELELKVGFNPYTGRIDIDDAPEINPERLYVSDAELLPEELDVEMTLNGFTFEGINDLRKGSDYTVSDEVVTLTESFLEDIEDAKTTLEFVFKKDSVEVIESFDILLYYLKNQPILEPDEVEFVIGETDGVSFEIEMELFGFELVQVMAEGSRLEEGDEYDLNSNGDELTIEESYLETLEVGVTTWTLLFERNNTYETLGFDITVMDMPVSLPVLDPDELRVDEEDELPDGFIIDVDLNGYTLEEIEDLDLVDDYTTSGALKVKLTDSYLESIEVPETTLELVFEKDNDEVTIEFEIILEYLYLEPVVTPDEVSFTEGETDGVDIQVDMELYGFELTYVIDHLDILEEGKDYDLDSDEGQLIINESYLEDLSDGNRNLVLIFERNSEVVYLNFAIDVETAD